MQFDMGGKKILFHRHVMSAADGYIVNHKNGMRNDNRLQNLNVCSFSQNSAYRANDVGKGGRGVRFRKSGKYDASISFMGTKRHLGTFQTKEEAERAYDLEAVKIHGIFATTNFDISNYKIPDVAESSFLIKPFKRGKRDIKKCCWDFGCDKNAGDDGLCWTHSRRSEKRRLRKEQDKWLRVEVRDKCDTCIQCGQKSFSRSLCSFHYRKMRESEGYIKPKKKYECSVNGCSGVAVKIAERLCSTHYKEKYGLFKNFGRKKSPISKCLVCGVEVRSRLSLCKKHYLEKWKNEKNKSS